LGGNANILGDRGRHGLEQNEERKVRKNKKLICFEELPKRLQHALEILVEWHSVLVYEIKKGMYGFYVLDEYMPNGANFTGLIESDYVCRSHFIQESVLKVINTKFKGIRCRYFPKGYLSMESLRIEVPSLCFYSQGYGFSIELHSNDYGFLDDENAVIAPAYVHVLDEDELEIGLLNITGPCPERVSDIREFRPPHLPGDPDPMKFTPLMKHRKNLVKWANSFTGEGDFRIKTWDWIKHMWISVHKDSR
jgi:hypothetical protein